MLGQRQRRWANIKTTLASHLVFGWGELQVSEKNIIDIVTSWFVRVLNSIFWGKMLGIWLVQTAMATNHEAVI